MLEATKAGTSFLVKAWCGMTGQQGFSPDVCAAVVAPAHASEAFKILANAFEVTPCGPFMQEIGQGSVINPQTFTDPVMNWMGAQWEYGINNTLAHCADSVCRGTLNFVIGCGGHAFKVLVNGTSYDAGYAAGKAVVEAGKDTAWKLIAEAGIPVVTAVGAAGIGFFGYKYYQSRKAANPERQPLSVNSESTLTA